MLDSCSICMWWGGSSVAHNIQTRYASAVHLFAHATTPYHAKLTAVESPHTVCGPTDARSSGRVWCVHAAQQQQRSSERSTARTALISYYIHIYIYAYVCVYNSMSTIVFCPCCAVVRLITPHHHRAPQQTHTPAGAVCHEERPY